MTLTIDKLENTSRFSSRSAWNNRDTQHKPNFLEKLFPPTVQAALKMDQNFSLGIDPTTGREFLIINGGHNPNYKGTRFNIYM